MTINLSATGNVAVPAIKLIEDLGFQLTFKNGTFTAQKGMDIFRADDPITLLGLIKLIEVRGENWHVTDIEIERIGRDYKLL